MGSSILKVSHRLKGPQIPLRIPQFFLFSFFALIWHTHKHALLH